MRRKVVHLEKNAAGRLLEDVGDRIRREMTVRLDLSGRQNPAYRLAARSIFTKRSSDFSGGRFAFPADFSEERFR
jgi:hypothetical protein